ncbi:hypothetical protein GOBAR_AA21441 [Gossypium barbadense]|uniref:RING-type E3 ubiquitin transferase n=1 Tax=Gossypium barbadense TaxID=3634 RepID=A0A2P5X7B7_GOSBA|nr:hypothetical protein GOBAR_AA21441 [Gossypium barbadense]
MDMKAVVGMRSEMELMDEIGSWLGFTSSYCCLVLIVIVIFFLFAVPRCAMSVIELLNFMNFNVFFTFRYKCNPTTMKAAATVTVPYCCVCLYEAEEGERLRRLPRCKHCFHVDCIDAWFQYRSTCPLCRNEVSIGLRRPHNQLVSFLHNLFGKIHH